MMNSSGKLPASSDGSRQLRELLARFNQTSCDYPRESTVDAVFSAQALHSPAAIAAYQGAERLSYDELERRSNQFARLLDEHGLARESLVGVLMGPSLELPAILLGILKAGAAYVPLDPDWSLTQMRFVLNDAGCPALVGDRRSIRWLNKLQWMCPRVRLLHCVDSDDVHGESEGEGQMMRENVWDFIRREVFDDISGGGFRSSYTGDWLSREVIDQYGDNVENKLSPLVDSSSRILEIGVASGISMFRLAPKAGWYCGTDMSENILETTREESTRRGLGNVDLRQLAAHEIDRLDAGRFDVAVVNSVIQCFSGHNYLRDVLRKLVAQVNDQGVIFLGNLWDQDLQEDFEQSLAEFQRQHEGEGYRTKTDRSEELFLSRSFFADLQHEIPEIASIEFSRMLGEDTSELSTYGYDALLRIDRNARDSASLPPRVKHQTDRRALATHSSDSFPSRSDSRGLAYVNYVSTDDDRPRGVMIEHRSILRLVMNTNYTRFWAKDRILHSSGLARDASTMEVWGPLLNSGAICFPDELAEVLDGERLGELIRHYEVTQLWLPSRSFNRLAAEDQAVFAPLTTLLLQGEDLSVELVNEVHRSFPRLRVVHCYGPAENTAFSHSYEVTESHEESLPIGGPIANSRSHVLDEHLQATPIGFPGELCLAGDGLARGYLNDEELTAERFPRLPGAAGKVGERVFRTGVFARWTADGNVELIDADETPRDSSIAREKVPPAGKAPVASTGPRVPTSEDPSPEMSVSEKVRTAIAGVLGEAQAESLTPTMNLAELGLDSMEKLKLQTRLERSFGVQLDPMFLFEHENLASIAGYFRNSSLMTPSVASTSRQAAPADESSRGNVDHENRLSSSTPSNTGSQSQGADRNGHTTVRAETCLLQHRQRSGRKDSSRQLVDVCLIPTPTADGGGERLEEPLNAMDQIVEGIYSPELFYYESLLDVGALKEALRLTLPQYPALTGRLDTTNGVHCIRGNAGLHWEHYRCSFRPPSPLATRRALRRAHLAYERNSMEMPRADEPLVFLRISTFEAAAVTVISINMSHALADGPAAYSFWRLWCWHYSRLTGNESPHPKPEPPQPLGQRVQPLPSNAPKTDQELLDEYPGRPSNPFHWSISALGRARLGWETIRSKEVEYRVDANSLKQLKKSLIRELGERGSPAKSISSMEVVLATMGRALHRASGRRSGELEMAILSDLRNRSPLFKGNYFGNAQTMVFPKNVPFPDSSGSNKDVAPSATVESLHLELRKCFAKGEELYSPWFEAARNLGHGHDLRRLVYETSTHGDVFFNCIVSVPWRYLTMGDSPPPATMGVLWPAIPDHLIVYPLSPNGDLCFSLRLPKSQHQRFSQSFAADGLLLEPLRDC